MDLNVNSVLCLEPTFNHIIVVTIGDGMIEETLERIAVALEKIALAGVSKPSSSAETKTPSATSAKTKDVSPSAQSTEKKPKSTSTDTSSDDDLEANRTALTDAAVAAFKRDVANKAKVKDIINEVGASKMTLVPAEDILECIQLIEAL